MSIIEVPRNLWVFFFLPLRDPFEGPPQKPRREGDLFANLLHLQKHRRGRGLLALSRQDLVMTGSQKRKHQEAL